MFIDYDSEDFKKYGFLGLIIVSIVLGIPSLLVFPFAIAGAWTKIIKGGSGLALKFTLLSITSWLAWFLFAAGTTLILALNAKFYNYLFNLWGNNI